MCELSPAGARAPFLDNAVDPFLRGGFRPLGDYLFSRLDHLRFEHHLLAGDLHTATEIESYDDAEQRPKAVWHDCVGAGDVDELLRVVRGEREHADNAQRNKRPWQPVQSVNEAVPPCTAVSPVKLAGELPEAGHIALVDTDLGALGVRLEDAADRVYRFRDGIRAKSTYI